MRNLRLCQVILVCTVFFWGNTFTGHALDSQQITELIQSARQGDTRAMRNLGRAYYEGDGVLKDPARAKCWIRQARF